MRDSESSSTYVFGEFRLAPAQRLLQHVDGQDVVLRGKVFDLLCYLIRHKGRLVGKTELLEVLWPGMVVEENNLNQTVSALRQALGDDARSPDYIVTIKGRGYQFVGDVKLESTSEDKSADTVGAASTGIVRYWPLLLSATAVVAAISFWMSREPDHVLPATPIVERFADARLSIVTDYSGSHSEPTLSPDGNMMAYVSDVSGTAQIWVKNLQRGEPIQVTNGPYPAGSPSWSPDDNQILFDRNGPNGLAIHSVGTLGSPAAKMIVEGARAPNYAKRINAFVYSSGRQVWIARNDGRDREKIIGIPSGQGFAAREPALSPDGKLVAFIHADEGPLGNLWLIAAEGGEARQLTTPETSGGIVSQPEWSADGKFILFSVEASFSGGQLWQFDVANGKAAPLTKGANGAHGVTISSDGKRLAFTATRTSWKLTRIDPLTTETSTIFESREPILLPIATRDGKQIVYFTRNSSGVQIATIDSDGSNARQLTFNEPGENALPTWTGDGAAILYYRGDALHRLDPSNGSDEKIFDDFHWSTRNWITAFGNRVSYHNFDIPTGMRRTVVRELYESAEIELAAPIESAQWSNDGKELIGWLRQTDELLICNPDTATCRNIEDNGKSVNGMRPMWSSDGQQVYYLRLDDKRDCCTLWRIDVDGTSMTRIAELQGHDLSNSYFGIDADSNIFHNHLDRNTDEIWLATMPD